MWQAIIAKQEDNLYYLLKFFAESLDDDILKATRKPLTMRYGVDVQEGDVKDYDPAQYLAQNTQEQYLRRFQGATKKVLAQRKKLIDANKKLAEELNEAQKITDKDLPNNKKLSDIKSQMTKLRTEINEYAENPDPNQKERVKELREKLEAQSKKYNSALTSYSSKMKERADKITAQIKDNDAAIKLIGEKVQSAKKQKTLASKEKSLTAYMKKPTMANLQKYFDEIADREAIIRFASGFKLDASKDIEGLGNLRSAQLEEAAQEFKPVEATEKIKEKFDAQLRGLGYVGPESVKTVLENISSRKSKKTTNKPFNQLGLMETIFTDEDIKELKDLISDNKTILESLKQNIELPVPSGAEPKEHFSAVLNQPEGSKVSPNRNIHDAHKGAVYRIYEILRKYYYDRTLPENKRNTAKKLMRRLEKLNETKKGSEFKNFKVPNLGTKGYEKEEKDKVEDIDRNQIQNPEFLNELAVSTIDLYEMIYRDLDLTKKQAQNAEQSKEVENIIEVFSKKISKDFALREAVILILDAFADKEEAKDFMESYLFDDEYDEYRVPKIHRKNLSESNREKIMDVGTELFEELSQPMETSEGKKEFYVDRINDIIKDTGVKIPRRKMKAKTLNKLLKNPSDSASASKYVRKYVYEKLKKLLSDIPEEKDEFGRQTTFVVDDDTRGQLKNFKDWLDNFDENIEITKKIRDLQKKLPQDKRGLIDASAGEQLDFTSLFDEKKLNEYLQRIYDDDSQKEEAEETKKLINESKALLKERPALNWTSLFDSIPDTKQARAFFRVYNNKRTRDNMKTVFGEADEGAEMPPPPKRDRSKIYDTENKLSIGEETILQVLKRKDKASYDKYIKFGPEKLKAQLKFISDKIKQNEKKLSEENKKKYNQLDTDYERKEFIIEQMIARRKKK